MCRPARKLRPMCLIVRRKVVLVKGIARLSLFKHTSRSESFVSQLAGFFSGQTANRSIAQELVSGFTQRIQGCVGVSLLYENVIGVEGRYCEQGNAGGRERLNEGRKDGDFGEGE